MASARWWFSWMLAHQLQLAILLQEEGYCVQMIWWVVQTMRDLANIAQWHSGIITIISSFSLRYVNMAKLTPERCFLSSTLLRLAVYLW